MASVFGRGRPCPTPWTPPLTRRHGAQLTENCFIALQRPSPQQKFLTFFTLLACCVSRHAARYCSAHAHAPFPRHYGGRLWVCLPCAHKPDVLPCAHKPDVLPCARADSWRPTQPQSRVTQARRNCLRASRRVFKTRDATDAASRVVQTPAADSEETPTEREVTSFNRKC